MNSKLYTYLAGNILDVTTVSGEIFYAVITFIVAWILGRTIHLAIHRYLDKADAAGTDSTSVRFLGQLTKVVVYVLAFLFYTHLIPALQSLGTAWLASVGVVSVVVGLAAQSTLSNLVAGISLVLYRPFRIGDRIQITAPTGPEIGMVESVDLGYTTLRTTDGRRLVLPNSIIANQTSINLSRNLPHVSCDVTITLATGADIEKARAIILDTAKTIASITKIKGCFVTSFTSAGTVVTLSAWCVDPGDVAQIKSDVLEKVKAQFDKDSIKVV